MSTITLLHVSDVHFGVHNPGDQKRITDGVLGAIAEHLSKGRSPPAFGIFSGDLTQSATPDQFEETERWLKTLSEAASGAPLFIVPGNHDVRRPEEGSDIPLELRAAHHSEKHYSKWFRKVKAVPLLRPFFEWHERAKTGMPIRSTWTLDAPFACRYTTTLSGINLHLIGLNTATLSCDNDDRYQLVADEVALNEELAKTSARTELVVLVTHHPIKVGEHLEQWLVEWNDKRLCTLLLQQTGPHLYLHGHLHHGTGIGTSQNTGQNLTSFGAGATYQSDQYPMKFAFYDIQLAEGQIKPWVYVYEGASGLWTLRDSESHAIRSVLPVSPGAGNEELRKRIDTLQAFLDASNKERQRLRNAYKRSHEAVDRVVQELYPTIEGLRHHFESITSRTIIHANGDAEVIETFVITSCSRQPVHFWQTNIWADPESAEMPFIDDINLEIVDLGENTDVTYLSTLDEGREKTLCVFFLPEIKSDERRKIKLKYRWPGYVRHFISGDRVWFEWAYRTGLPDQPLPLEFILDIDQSIGLIDYKNEGRTDIKWKITQPKNIGTRLRYRCNKGALTRAYKVVVWRTEPVSAAPITSAARHE